MKLYIEPIFAYNEFEQELQYLELSYLIEDNEGNLVKENTLRFPPVFGVDRTLLNLVGIDEKLVGNTNQKEIVDSEIELINSIINEETVVLSWNNILNQIEGISSSKRIIVYQITKENSTLERIFFNITGQPLNGKTSRRRLLATKMVYEHYRNNTNSLTENKVEITITENIEE